MNIYLPNVEIWQLDEEGIQIYNILQCEWAYEHFHILCIASLG